MPQLQDPDSVLIVLFKHSSRPNEAKSIKEGRPVEDDVEVCEVRFPGRRDFSVFPAHAVWDHVNDPFTGRKTAVTYAQRFQHQYRQFTAHAEQTRTGTPLDYVPFLTAARRAELRGLNIYTVEALAHIDGQEVKNLGPGGREMKNQAEEYIAAAKAGAVPRAMEAEMIALKAHNQVLEDDVAALKARSVTPAKDALGEMTAEQLRAYITTRTGHAPHGSLSLKVLQRMAADATSVAADAEA